MSDHLDLAPERAGQPRMMTVSSPLELDHGHWYSPAAVREMLAAERERWEESVRLTWRMVDPFKPAGQPGSYARGNYNGIVDALTTLRANLKTIRAQKPAP